MVRTLEGRHVAPAYGLDPVHEVVGVTLGSLQADDARFTCKAGDCQAVTRGGEGGPDAPASTKPVRFQVGATLTMSLRFSLVDRDGLRKKGTLFSHCASV